MKHKKLILIIVSLILVSTLAIAQLSQTTKISFTPEEKASLTKNNITKLKIIESGRCLENYRCFNLSGDINEELTKIPDKVSSGYKIIRTKENRTVMINGKPVMREVFVNRQTTEKVYRDITDAEVYNILDNMALAKLNKYLPKNEIVKVPKNIKYGDVVILDGKEIKE